MSSWLRKSGRDRVSGGVDTEAADHTECDGVHDHLGPPAPVLGIPDAERVNGLVIRIRSCAIAGAPASTTIRRAFGPHHPPVSAGIDSNETENPRDSANSRIGVSGCTCESPVNGSHGGPSGACSRSSIADRPSRDRTRTRS